MRSGIVINGRMVYGHDGNAGELGHLVMKRNNGRMCGCGRTGCLEAYCSATGVARTAREFLEEAFDKNVMPIFRGKTQIILSELKESDAAVLGASALGW